MNIAYINKSWTNKVPDGIATYTKTVATLMASRGHQVHVITLSNTNYQLEDRGLIFHFVGANLPASLLKLKIFQVFQMLIFQIGAYWQFRKIEKEFDIIESPDAAAEGFFVALFLNKKLVTRLHTPLIFCSILNGQRPGIARKILGWMEYFQVSRSKKLSCPSKALSEKISMAWNLTGQIKIISNPLSPIINPTKKYRRTNFLFIGGFDAEEGLKRFEAAFTDLKKNFPTITACAVGKFSLPGKKLRKSGIMYLGSIDQAELFGRIKSADAVAFSTLWENFPYVLLEAGLLKKITICPKIGGYAEIVQDGFNGLLFEVDAKNGLSAKMKYCLNLSKIDRKKIGLRASKKAQQYSDPELMAKFEKYYLKSKE